MSVLVKALTNDEPRNFNAIILDIGGRVTDVAIVFGGGIWGTRPLPLGGENFDLSFWLSGVETALSDFEGVKSFPNRIILGGGGAQIEGLKEGLLDYPLMRTLPFVSQPVVEVRTDVGPQSMKLVGQEIVGGNDAD
jgi:cell division ATPase FtsA